MVQTPIKPKTTERQEVIDWLKANGYPALPVAPIQPADKYPAREKDGSIKRDKAGNPVSAFTGKNPSYLDQNGIPHLVNHRQYQSQLPCDRKLKNWFANPLNGVGTLGGWNNTIWLDLDLKQFASKEECDRIFWEILEAHPELQRTFLEESHSGGWRIGVRVKQKPNFTNFCLTQKGGAHVGEALGEGRFTVLAPTIGPSGNSYKSINRAVPVEVETLESIGVYPVSTKVQRQASLTPHPAVSYIPGSIPLEQLGNDTSREILQGSCPTGDRSKALTTASNEWYGWQNWTRENGIAVTGTPEDLAHYAGQQLGIDSDRVDRILKGIDITACHPAALHRGEEESCWKKIYRLDKATFEGKCPAHIKDVVKAEWRRGKNTLPSGNGGADGGDGGDGKLITHPEFTPASSDEIEARIDVLIAQKASGSKLTSCLNRLAAESQWHVSELRKLYFERKGETEQTEEQVEAQSLLPSLLEVHQLNLQEFLWGDDGLLAEAMIQTANAMPTSPEFLFTTLLPAAAALIGTSSRIVVKAKGKYKQPCIFLATVVGRTGQLKTPSQNVVIAPLNRLEIKANEQYQSALEKYEIDLANWKKDKDADPADKPKLPTRKRYITKDATIESLERIHGQNPRGLLVHRDELAEDFKADNAYRGGKGGDTEKKLDQFNGSPIFTDRKEREVVLERSAISRTGSIQWEVLQSLMGDGRDDNGAFARWLFCAAEAPPRFINLLEDDIDTGIEELLTHLYKRLEQMPDKDYLLSFEAKQLFQDWQHELVRAELNESHTGLQAVYPKIEAYTARFALWLHLVNSALAEITPPAVVGDRTMSAAIKLAKYYLDQAKLVTATNSPQSGLTGILLKIQKYAQGKPNGVKVYKLKSAIKALRNTTPEDLLTHCTWLTEHDYGSLKDNTYFANCVELLPNRSTRSIPDSTVVLVNPTSELLTNCCPEVNTVNTNNSGCCSDFVDFVDPNDHLFNQVLVTELNNLETDQFPIEKVNTVKNLEGTYTESTVDRDQQLVNKGQQGQQTGSADNAIAPIPLEQKDATLADEPEEAIALTPALQLAILLQMSQSREEVEALTESVEPEAKTEAFAPTGTTGSESPVATTNQLEEQNVGLEDYCVQKRPYPVENGLERAIAIREIYLNATSKEEVVTSKQTYSHDECKWVQNWLKRYQPVAYCQWQETQKRVGLR